MYIRQKYDFEAILGGKLRLEEPVQMSGQIWPFVGNPSGCPDIYVQIRQVKCPDRCGQVVGRVLCLLSGVLITFLFDSLKTLLAPVLHSLLSAICVSFHSPQLSPRNCIIVQRSQFRPRVYCLPLLIQLRILSHILSRPAGCWANSIRPSTYPNNFER